MKKLLLTLILLSFFTFYSYTYSESSDNGRVIATVNIYDTKILSQDNNTIKLQFDLSNREYVQPDIRYAVRLTTDNGDIIEEKVYDEVVSLNENTDIIKEVEYEAPSYLNGKYEISVIAKNRSGLTLALSRNFEIVLNGSNDYVEINESSCYLKVEGFDEKYNLSQGVDILNEENLIATCKLKNNSDKSKKLNSNYKTYLRNGFGDEVDTENKSDETISLNSTQEKEISFNIPKAKLPQAYDVKLSLKDDGGNIVSNEIIIHYVISGVSATIQNVRLDKDSYKKGENALIDIFYSKSASNFIGARNDFIKDNKLFFGIEIKDSNNNLCVNKSEKELTDSTQLNLSLLVINNCINPSIVSYIKDESGKILDKKEYNIKSESIQKKKVFNNTENTSKINLIFISIVFILALIGIIYLFKNKKNKNKNKKKNNTIIQIIFMFMLIGLFIGDNKEVNADSISNTYLVRAGQYRFPGVSQVPHDYTITVNFDKKQYNPGEKVYVSSNSISVICANSFINSILNVKNNGVQIFSKNFNDTSVQTKNIQNISFTAPSTPGTYSLEFELIDNRCRNSTGKNSGWSPSGYDEGPYLFAKTSKLNYDAGISTRTTDSTRAAILASYPNVKAHYDVRAAIEGVWGNHVYCDKLKTKVVFNYKVVAATTVPVKPVPITPVPVTPVPITPVPVITTSFSTSNGCSSYISSRTTTWSNCNIEGNWSTAGVIKCRQTPSYTPVTSSCGSQTCTTTYSNGSPIGISCSSCTGCPSNSPKPNNPDVVNNVVASINSVSSTCNDKYANDSDTCNLNFNVSASTLQSRGISGWGTNGNISSIVDKSGEKQDRISMIGNALNFASVNSSGIPASTSNNFNVMINNIKSRTPFVSSTGKVGIQIGGVWLDLTNIGYSFKKPFVGYIKSSIDEGLKWDALPSLGTKMLYKLGATPKNILNDYSLEVDTGSISYLGDNIVLEDTQIQSYVGQGPYIFSTRINSSKNAIELNNTPGIQVNLPIISYDLNGNKVRYYLSEFENGDDTNSVKIMGSNFIGLKVIGELQGNGKTEFTGQEKNISSLSTLENRTQIRKNAYTYILNMFDGQILDGVKYVEGRNITISGDQDYETLVVKDGNVIIEGDLNQSKKKLGIIVLKDNYDVNSDYINNGNVYVESGVKEINATIYADGGFISANSLGLPYTSDSTTRTTYLQKQLVVNGNLFTRNTIGGAQYIGGYYLLPGGTKITDFNKAMVYDLNYIRRGNQGCDKNADLDCNDVGEYNEGFILKYNSKIQTDPPKLFY